MLFFYFVLLLGELAGSIVGLALNVGNLDFLWRLSFMVGFSGLALLSLAVFIILLALSVVSSGPLRKEDVWLSPLIVTRVSQMGFLVTTFTLLLLTLPGSELLYLAYIFLFAFAPFVLFKLLLLFHPLFYWKEKQKWLMLAISFRVSKYGTAKGKDGVVEEDGTNASLADRMKEHPEDIVEVTIEEASERDDDNGF